MTPSQTKRPIMAHTHTNKERERERGRDRDRDRVKSKLLPSKNEINVKFLGIEGFR
jgi:hypothetical protein